MSRLQNIKDQNPKFNRSLIDVLKILDPSDKNTYLEFFMKFIKNMPVHNGSYDELKHEINDVIGIPKEELEQYSFFEIKYIYSIANIFFSFSDLKKLRRFEMLRQENKISGVDISKFSSFEDIKNQLSIYELKAIGSEIEKLVIKDFENDEWLIVRPLSHISSCKYGSNTKWCTTAEYSDHFDRYSNRGILIYTINKITGYKVATFYSLISEDKELSFWDQVDRRIDSMETELPFFILEKIGHIIKTEKQCNYEKLSLDEKLKLLDTKMKEMCEKVETNVRSLGNPDEIPVPEIPLNRRAVIIPLRFENEAQEYDAQVVENDSTTPVRYEYNSDLSGNLEYEIESDGTTFTTTTW